MLLKDLLLFYFLSTAKGLNEKPKRNADLQSFSDQLANFNNYWIYCKMRKNKKNKKNFEYCLTYADSEKNPKFFVKTKENQFLGYIY